MKNVILTYLTLSIILGLVSCSQGDTPADERTQNKGEVITFKVSMQKSDSRADVVNTATFEECFVTCFNPNSNDPSLPYFEAEQYIKTGEELLPVSAEPYTWPTGVGELNFFAYHPSADVMNGSLVNNTKVENGALNIDYSLDSFHVAEDISQQVDFIKAYAPAARPKEAEKGVLLDFKHQLSLVEVKLYRSQGPYNFRVAGIRLGNPAVTGKYHFYADETVEPWDLPENPFGKVEYIYRPGDTVKTITSNTKENAVSIMGLGGPAMVVPTKNDAWGAKNDPQLKVAGKTMYFSILVNVTLADTQSEGRQLFPAEGLAAADQVKMVTFAVDKSTGIIKARLNENDGKFYISATEEYTLSGSDEVKQFGWAAVPISVDWKRGKKYIYTLNYTNGIGVRDPESPQPGNPILGGDLNFTVSFEEWGDPVNNDINMPSKKD